LQQLLESVKEQAGLHVDAESVEAAVRRGRGSARDALSALDQVAATGSSDSARPELTAVLVAVAEGEASDVLVHLSGLLASGWGPQQLATELVDDLRQGFLAVLAPELCALAGSSRAQFISLAESMGLPRVVRGMEILGRALIDMRDAPDAQVVLEIALVRVARPDLDPGIEALAERVGTLERSSSAGAPNPRPAARSEPITVVPIEAPQAPEAPQADVGRRPSVGAVRRRQNAVSSTAAEPEVTSTPEPPPAPVADAPTPASEPTPLPDRDSLTQAWGDGILQGLSGRAKAIFSGGRFVAVEDGEAHFALPTAPHRDHCLEQAPFVEEALARHFGVKVPLRLVVDDAQGGVVAPGAAPPRSNATTADRPTAGDPEEDPVDLSPLDAPDTDQAEAAHTKLLEAFPGASEVDT
jgi:DNA polymerase-3 subunit gamma/tau